MDLHFIYIYIYIYIYYIIIYNPDIYFSLYKYNYLYFTCFYYKIFIKYIYITGNYLFDQYNSTNLIKTLFN